MNFRIGIDIGGTNTVIGLVNPKGLIVEQRQIPTVQHAAFEDYLDEIAHCVEELRKKYHAVLGIGIGAPNGNAYTGNIEYAPNLPWKGELPIVQQLTKQLGLKVFLSNDANAAAMGEKLYGGAKSMNDFIVITLGTGVGSGIYSNGNLVLGHDAFAGEIGHVITIPEGRTCACGRKGCIEAYASAQGVVKTFLELKTRFGDENLTEYAENAKTKDIFDLACKGSACAIKTFDETAKVLALCLANSIAHTSPEAIFIFGGLSNADKFLLTPLRGYLDEFVLHNYKGKVKLLRSELLESDAAILGASALVK